MSNKKIITSINNSSDQKKAFVVSFFLYATLLLILFFIRFWPPSNMTQLAGGGGGGVTLNFGDNDFGSGANYKNQILNVKDEAKQTPTKVTPDEAILAQENNSEESVAVPEKIKIKNSKPTVETKPEITKPKVSNITNDALSNLLRSNSKGGDGDDKVSGNKGKPNGNLKSNGYYGTGGTGGGTGTGKGIGTGNGYNSGTGGGSGGGTGYSLGNRKAKIKPAPKYTCNEQGKIVVEVWVDKNGNTTNAIAGTKGTTNTAKCLLDQARIAALNTKWDSSNDAPEKQIGQIVYNFNLN